MNSRTLVSRLLACTLGLFAAVAAGASFAQTRIGFVSLDRILRDAAPAQRAQKKIEAEFAKRDQELTKSADQIKRLQEKQGITFRLASKVTGVDMSGKVIKVKVEPAAGGAVMMAGPAGGDGSGAAAAVEKTEFDVVLEGFDAAKKIGVIRWASCGMSSSPSGPTSTFPNGARRRMMSSTTSRCSRRSFGSLSSSVARSTGRVPASAMVR